jgi:PAS domain S-box-containing protein
VVTGSFYPVRGADGRVAGVGSVVVEVTERVEAERARQRVLEQTRFLADASAALDASLDYDETLQAVADLAVRRIADWCAIDMVDEEGGLRNVAVAHIDGEKVALAKQLQERYPPRLDAPTGAAAVALHGAPPELYSEIPDAMLEEVDDPEVREIVRSLGMTSAMVVPLRARGRTLGALTLIGTHDRPRYGPDDLAFAQEVASRAALAVDNARLYGEAREQDRRSHEARALLDTLIEEAPIGLAFYDRDLRYVRVNKALAEVDALPAADYPGRRTADVKPDLAAVIEGHLRHVLATGEPLDNVELAVPSRSVPGTVQHQLRSYFPVVLEAGEPFGVGVTVLDMSARVEAREELRAQRDLYEAILRAQSELGEGFALLQGARIVYVNAAAERIAGRSEQELLALDSLLDLVVPEHRAAVAERIEGVRRGIEPRPEGFQTEILRPDGTRVAIEAAGRPLLGGDRHRLVILARDVTERRREETERERLLATEQAARRAAEAAHARVQLLADASAILERALSARNTLDEVARLLVARLADACSIDVLGPDARLRREGAASRAAGGRETLLRLADGDRLSPSGDHPIAQVLRDAQPRFLDDVAATLMHDVAPSDDEIERLRTIAGRSAALLPLVARGRAVGVLGLGWAQAGRRPSREEWILIEALAQRIALAVDSALQYQERAHVAQMLQSSLLPGALPAVPGADVAAEYAAGGEGMEVGGDFYDLFAVGGQDEWALVIGDVCGKGAEAAAVTALARYTLRAVTTRSPSPAATLATLNEEMLRQMPDPRFLTAVLGHLAIAPDGGARLTVASGGHPPPVVLRAAGTPKVVRCAGTLLGVVPEARSSDCVVALLPGDAVVLYTDGITEASRDRPIAPEALGEALQEALPDGAGAIARAAVRLADRHAEGALRDDVAVLVLRLTGEAAPPPGGPAPG